jgi:hypothetical protein
MLLAHKDNISEAVEYNCRYNEGLVFTESMYHQAAKRTGQWDSQQKIYEFACLL